MTSRAADCWLAHGSAEPLTSRTSLRAGPWELVLEMGDLRQIRYQGREVIRRIYGAVRDQNWCTIPGVITDQILELPSSGFRAVYTRTHRAGDIHFVWHAVITGGSDGTISFGLDGEALSTFLKNRIGLCVLHPILECCGASCRTLHIDGSTRLLKFPMEVAREQPVGGFSDLSGLTHEVEPGVWATVQFEGDSFETEDQRNWIDASFKTYSTPLRYPMPVEIRQGTRVRQRVTLKLEESLARSDRPPKSPRRREEVALEIDRNRSCRLPEIGLGMALHGATLTDLEVSRLSRLGTAFLRTDLWLSTLDWIEDLRRAARDAMELGAALELAIHLPRTGDGDLKRVMSELSRLKADLCRALIFREGQRSTLPLDLAHARLEVEECGVAIGAGTDGDLYQLQLQPVPVDDADFICWSMNPQVHAADLSSLLETPEAVPPQIWRVQKDYPDKPLVISPVTLKPRYAPGVRYADLDVSIDGELPSSVDPRQSSLVAAAWTLAMLRAVAESGAESVTFYETTGWRGVLERPGGSPMPGRFVSVPGGVFPLYHALADVGEWVGAEVLPTRTTEPQRIHALTLRKGGKHRLILANLGRESRLVDLRAMPETREGRRLDTTTAVLATTQPEAFRRHRFHWRSDSIEIPAFGLVTLLQREDGSAT